MKTIATLIILGAFMAISKLASAANKVEDTQDPRMVKVTTVSPINAIEVVSGITLNYKVGNDIIVKIKANKSVMEHVRTEVKGKKLQCYINSGSSKINVPNGSVVIDLIAPSVEYFKVYDGATVNITSDLATTDKIKMDVMEDGKLFAKAAEANEVDINVKGKGQLTLPSLKTQYADIDAKDYAMVVIDNIDSEKVNIKDADTSQLTITGKSHIVDIGIYNLAKLDMSAFEIGSGDVRATDASMILTNNTIANCVSQSFDKSVIEIENNSYALAY